MIVNHKIGDLKRFLIEQPCMSVIPDSSRMAIFLYLIAIIFNQAVEKNDPSERGCQTESRLYSRSRGYV